MADASFAKRQLKKGGALEESEWEEIWDAEPVETILKRYRLEQDGGKCS